MWDVYEDKECSWTLIALSHYLADINTSWDAADGQVWSVEKIIAMEAAQDLNESACGGSHRLIGLAMALNRHLDEGHAPRGAWLAADETIQQAIETARKFQNPDGSFSSHYFSRPGASVDLAVDLGATGHTLEFLAVAMTQEQLQQAWVQRAVVHLCELFHKTKDVRKWRSVKASLIRPGLRAAVGALLRARCKGAALGQAPSAAGPPGAKRATGTTVCIVDVRLVIRC